MADSGGDKSADGDGDKGADGDGDRVGESCGEGPVSLRVKKGILRFLNSKNIRIRAMIIIIITVIKDQLPEPSRLDTGSVISDVLLGKVGSVGTGSLPGTGILFTVSAL